MYTVRFSRPHKSRTFTRATSLDWVQTSYTAIVPLSAIGVVTYVTSAPKPYHVRAKL